MSRLYVAGTDVPAVDGLKGRGEEPLFSNSRNSAGDREINATSKRDLAGQIQAAIAASRSGQVQSRMDSEEARERFASLKSAYEAPSGAGSQWEKLGEVFTEEIWETLGREGFTSKVLATQNVKRGDVARVRVRKKDIAAYQVTSDVKIIENRIRQDWVYPATFTIGCNISIENKEINQNSADILDEKFQDGLEAQLVREDKITKALMDRAATSFNDLILYTSFNPTIAATLREQVNRWGNWADLLLIAWDVTTDMLSDPDFQNAWDPVTKHELVLEGGIGRLYGMNIHTDGLRYPTLQVLQPGDIYAVASQMTVGAKTVVQELKSTAVDHAVNGRAARGWFITQEQGQVIVNGRAVAAARRLP